MNYLCHSLVGAMIATLPLSAQADTAGCSDSTAMPKFAQCRIDNCEKKDADQRTAPVRENEKGEPITAAIDGESRSVMYECPAATTPALTVQQAVAKLRANGFSVLYQFVGMEGAVTARKEDLWILLEAASRYYTLTELKATPPDFESINEAIGFADAIERYGHVSLYGIHFEAGKAELPPDANPVLHEIAVMLENHPEWRVRIESHTDNTGNKMANMTLTARRSSAIAAWLSGRGIKRPRLENTGLGDTRPVAENATEEGRAKNERIELVKLSSQP